MEIEMAEVTAIIEAKVKVKFNQDDTPSELEYPKLISYSPKVGDKVLMLKTNTSFICLGGIGAEAEGRKEDTNIVGEYKFFAKDKGLLWKGWAKCDGRALDSNTYPELYAEIGTSFSGSGLFNLPNTTGRVLSDSSGETFGSSVGLKSVALTASQIPNHKHNLNVSKATWTGSGFPLKHAMVAPSDGMGTSTDAIVSTTGGGGSHENRQPTLYGGYYYIYTGVM